MQCTCLQWDVGFVLVSWQVCCMKSVITLRARFMGPTWGPSGAYRTQVGPILAPWTLLSGNHCCAGKMYLGNINIYLHFLSFFNTETGQVEEILPQKRQERVYIVWSIPCLLMAWWYREQNIFKQNILPIHLKVCSLLRSKNLRAHRFTNLVNIFDMSPETYTINLMWNEQWDHK